MKILLKYMQHVVGDQDHHYESLDTDWKSLKWLFLNFLAIQMLSGLLKNEQMVILKTTFLKRILILYAKTIFFLRGLKMKNSTWNVICTIGQTLRIFPKIHFFHVLVLLIYLCNYLCNMYFFLFSICFS